MNGAATLQSGTAGDPRRGARSAGTWYWQAQAEHRLLARLIVLPANRIEVDLWWDRDGGRPDVQLVFGLYPDHVELGCLRGNGFNAPGLHQAGFGTFAVNLAVQAMQYHLRPSLVIGGVLSNTDEDGLPAEERARLEENRRAFWRRFGLDVVTFGDPPLDYLRGTVGVMRTIATGTVGGAFPRLVALDAFSLDRPAGPGPA